AAISTLSRHVGLPLLAEPVVRYARARGIEPPPRRNLHYEIGLGVRASVDGLFVLVGSDRLLRLSGIDVGRFAERRPTGCESQIRSEEHTSELQSPDHL